MKREALKKEKYEKAAKIRDEETKLEKALNKASEAQKDQSLMFTYSRNH